MSWQEGRRLVSASSGTASLTFTYDSDGLRLKKDAGAIDSEYFYADGKLVRMHVRNNTVGLWQIFDFFYDHNGHPYAVKHKIDNAYTTYYYITNLQGDVLGLTTADGTAVVNYTYDPYGKVLSTTGTKAAILGLYNPLRYRGYVYDHETALYYLQSRYYDPQTARFLNADSYASTGQGILGNNMFAYCLNNPITFEDTTGSAARVCYSDNDRLEEAPWFDHSPGGGGIPRKDYSPGPNYYGSVADKFYTIRILNALGINELSDFKPVSRMGKGIKNIAAGVSLILAPVPTITDDLVGMYKITTGIINTCWGFAEWVGNLNGT